MTPPHFFVLPLAREPSLVQLSEDDTRHALRSLRLRPGEEVTVSDGNGRVGRGALLGQQDDRAVIEVLEVRAAARASPPVSVVVSPPKGERLKWMVQKLAEIGVESVWLMEAERSVRVVEGARSDRALERLRAIAREAAMQSRQDYLMEVGLFRGPGGGSSKIDSKVRRPSVVMLHGAAPERLQDLLPPDPPSLVTLVVGPEGGFSAAEVDMARGAGQQVASLGPNVLRTETAAVVGAALALARYGRLG